MTSLKDEIKALLKLWLQRIRLIGLVYGLPIVALMCTLTFYYFTGVQTTVMRFVLIMFAFTVIVAGLVWLVATWFRVVKPPTPPPAPLGISKRKPLS